jgi:hypothetical protein
LQALAKAHIGFEQVELPHQRLRVGLIIPKIWGGRLRFQILNLRAFISRVKDTPEPPPRGASAGPGFGFDQEGQET